MNAKRAKQLLIGGFAAIALAFLLEILNSEFIASAGMILFEIALLVTGGVAVIIATIWYLMHPMGRKA